MQKKLTIEEIKKFTNKKKGKCLSDVYKNAHSKLKWQCENGHIWKTKASTIIYLKTWCPKCAIERIKNGIKKYNIDNMKEFVKEKGGDCLSNKFINSNKKLRWKCKKGHIWEQRWSNIKNGSWCPKCMAEKRRLEWINQYSSFKEG